MKENEELFFVIASELKSTAYKAIKQIDCGF